MEIFANKVEIQNGAPETTISLDADSGVVKIGGNGAMGTLQLFASPHDPTDNTKVRLTLDSYAGGVTCNHVVVGRGEAGSIRINDGLNKETVRLDGATGDLKLGGNGVNGDVIVRNASGEQTVRLNGNTGAVTIRDWTISAPDYVFDEGYVLRPLSEVEAFVTTEHHLPEIPSSAQIARDGISVGHFCISLLKKIEELSLYAIYQQHTISEQQQRLARLETALAEGR